MSPASDRALYRQPDRRQLTDTARRRRPTVVALAPPTMQAVTLAADGRDRGLLLLSRAGRRMTADNMPYLVAALARDAALPVDLTPARAAALGDHHRARRGRVAT